MSEIIRLKYLLKELLKKGWNEEDLIKVNVLNNELIELSKSNDKIITRKKIIKLLKEKSFSERVQGRFERNLSKKELNELKKLLEEKKIIIYKKPKYKQGVYCLAKNELKKVNEKETMNSFKSGNNFNKSGFALLNNQNKAMEIANKFKEKIKKGEIKTLKLSEKEYCLIDEKVLKTIQQKILDCFKEKKKLTYSEIIKKSNLSEEAIKVGNEFLKEEGELIEKKKNLFELL